MKTFNINGKDVKAKAFDFNLICDLEDMGISVEKAQEIPLSMIRAYIGLCLGMSKENAGKEIEQHIVNGGTFEEASAAMSYEMENSDFFRALNKSQIQTSAKKTAKN